MIHFRKQHLALRREAPLADEEEFSEAGDDFVVVATYDGQWNPADVARS